MTDEEYQEKYGNYGTEKFFTDGNWEIHGNPLRNIYLDPAVSRVVHFCDPADALWTDSTGEYCTIWSNPKHRQIMCPYCTKTMPESVQTVWILHNFDVDFEGVNR